MVGNRMGVSAVGIGWYKRDDYKRILEVMEDADKLPLTFDKWQSKAEALEAQIKKSGGRPIRAHINADDFVAWCAANGLHVDSHARNKWGSEVSYREVMGQKG